MRPNQSLPLRNGESRKKTLEHVTPLALTDKRNRPSTFINQFAAVSLAPVH